MYHHWRLGNDAIRRCCKSQLVKRRVSANCYNVQHNHAYRYSGLRNLNGGSVNISGGSDATTLKARGRRLTTSTAATAATTAERFFFF
jgi:hypothetical protein